MADVTSTWNLRKPNLRNKSDLWLPGVTELGEGVQNVQTFSYK